MENIFPFSAQKSFHSVIFPLVPNSKTVFSNLGALWWAKPKLPSTLFCMYLEVDFEISSQTKILQRRRQPQPVFIYVMRPLHFYFFHKFAAISPPPRRHLVDLILKNHISPRALDPINRPLRLFT